MFTAMIPTTLGNFQASVNRHGLYSLIFPRLSFNKKTVQGEKQVPASHPTMQEVAHQLGEYLDGSRRSFTLPLSIHGTVFQKAVWEQLSTIPYGNTITYGQLAEKLGSRNKARAVGGAAHVNPLPLIIPCHRLIGANGTLTGFAGGLELKKYLLDLEVKTIEDQSDNR